MHKLKQTVAFLLMAFISHLSYAGNLQTAVSYLKVGEFQKALPILQTLAEKNDPIAQANLGTMYMYGDGVAKDMHVAAAWYQKAATSGLPHPAVINAMYQMAILNRGYGGHPQNMDQAIFWYKQAAAGGDVEAMNQLGILYYDGDGVQKDYSQSLEWFTKAAQKDHPEAQSFIGDLYRFGRGVNKDFSEAVRWYEKAATKHYPHALFMLGVLYGQGLGVNADRSKSINYYQQAALRGHPEAKKLISSINQLAPTIEGIADDSEYGYRSEKAIRLGGESGHKQIAFLDQLRGPAGQKVRYTRTGACAAYKDESQPFGKALIDCYTVTYDGLDKPVTLFLDIYRSEKVFAPQGFNYINLKAQ